MLHSSRFDGQPLANADSIAAITAALQVHPIDPRGLGPFAESYESDQHSFDHPFGISQVATAMAWLGDGNLRKHKDVGSYGLKHHAERWGREQGLSIYVSNGAMLIALHAFGKNIAQYG